jgi:elongator complex protein 1
MPRGNIETIFPRALVLPAIRRSLDQGEYKAAFKVCRKHMVDLNILHDYDPLKFMGNISEFITQLKADHVNEFLTNLKYAYPFLPCKCHANDLPREEDVSQTLYKDTLAHRTMEETPLNTTPKSKINTICDAIVDDLRKDPTKHYESIVTAYVRKSPPDREKALLFVQELSGKERISHSLCRSNEQLGVEASDNSIDLKKEAISCICFIVDWNQLFETALGLYDLDLAVELLEEAQQVGRSSSPGFHDTHKK